jgi:hypothetical protein
VNVAEAKVQEMQAQQLKLERESIERERRTLTKVRHEFDELVVQIFTPGFTVVHNFSII